MIADPAVMSYVIPAPQCDVVANGGKWLDGVVFKNETVLADAALIQNGGTGLPVSQLH